MARRPQEISSPDGLADLLLAEGAPFLILNQVDHRISLFADPIFVKLSVLDRSSYSENCGIPDGHCAP